MAIYEYDLVAFTADEIRAYLAVAPEFVREVDQFDYTPLVAACTLGRIDLARVLLDAGAHPNAGLIPALHWAVGLGNRTLVEHLIRRGADPNAADVDDATPLHWAAGWGGPPDIRMMRLLLKFRADSGARDLVGKTVEDRIGPAAMREARRADA